MFPGRVRTRHLRNFFEKGAWPGSRDPLNFWALNANSSKKILDAKCHAVGPKWLKLRQI